MTDSGPTAHNEQNIPKRLTCDFCRQRKVKCDRKYPKCSRCLQLGHRCSYRGRSNNRNSHNALLSELQQRMDQAEAHLALTAYALVRTPDEPASNQLPTTNGTFTPLHSSEPTLTPVDDSVPSTRVSEGPMDISNERGHGRGISLDTNGDASYFPISEWASDVDIAALLNLGPLDSNMSTNCYSSSEPLGSAQWETNHLGDGFTMQGEADETAGLVSSFLQDQAPLFPIFYRERIEREMRQTMSASTRSLVYAMALSALPPGQANSRLAQKYHKLTRKHIDITEAKIDCTVKTASINTLQSLLLLIRYELQSGHCAQSFLTLGRAIRWAKLTGLYNIDSPQHLDERRVLPSMMPQMSLSVSQDEAEREEARRCFWALYIFEAYSMILSEGAIEGCEDSRISVVLPSPDVITSGFAPWSMPKLGETISSVNTRSLSSFTATVLTASLLRKVARGLGTLRPEAAPGRADVGFWDHYYQLLKLVDDTSALLEPFWNAPTPGNGQQDIVAYNLHLILKAIDIRLYQAGITERERKGLAASHSAESRQRLRDRASWMATAVRFKWSGQQPKIDITTPSCTFIRWALNMAANVYFDRNMRSNADDEAAVIVLQTALKNAEKGVHITPDYELDYDFLP